MRAAEHTAPTGSSCEAARWARTDSTSSSWSAKSRSSLEPKRRNRVLRLTPAARATSSMVVASKPFSSNSRSAAATTPRPPARSVISSPRLRLGPLPPHSPRTGTLPRNGTKFLLLRRSVILGTIVTQGDPMSDFDLYRTTEEHEALREAIRSVAEDKIAPHAADVDEKARFPQEAYEALRASDFHAPHVAEEYGGAGADALATCIVIEEVARVCASTSLIPAVNKLGSMPLILAGSDELKQRYLPELASGEAMFSYGLSEREAGSDTASMRTRAVRDGDDWILSGQKSWITNAGVSKYYTVMAVTDPDGPRGRNISAFVVHIDDPGFSFG